MICVKSDSINEEDEATTDEAKEDALGWSATAWGSMTIRERFANRAQEELSWEETRILNSWPREAMASVQVYADALIAIVGQPWIWPGVTPMCPGCNSWHFDHGEHEPGCPWLIAARALECA